MRGFRKLVMGVAVVAVGIVIGGVALRAQNAPAAVPNAPTGLKYVVNNSAVTLTWTPPVAQNYTSWLVEAGTTPGTTFFNFSTSQLVDPSKLPQFLTTFATGGVPTGTYYVRLRGANAEGLGAPSNEVVVPVTGGCQAPGAPLNVTAVVRGSFAYIAWNTGVGGQPASYTLYASYTPGGAPIVSFPVTTNYLNVGGIPAGAYYVKVVANAACGTSPQSSEILVNAPSNSPARTADPAAGDKLPFLWVRDFVLQAAAEARSQGLMNGAVSCPSRPGYPDSDIEARKTQPNGYINYIVDRLRTIDTRFGYNAKPTRAGAIVAGDEIAYHYGSDAAAGSPNVYLVDTLGGHCTFGNETADFRVITNEFGRYSTAGRF